MSFTLGEKLRQAREERGLSISEVAEQTRISALYLESIENNDYRILPGGIFNKGFVKSYARHVGINDQEALQDYAALIAEQGSDVNDDPKTYRPEVLTDERSRSGLVPTVIFSVIIVGLIVWGVLAFLKNNPFSQTETLANANANQANQNAQPIQTPTPTFSTDEIKFDFKALNNTINVSYSIDGKKMLPRNVTPNEVLSLNPQQSLIISYYKGFTPDKVQLTLNGKQIAAPAPPAKGNVTFEINKNNVAQILQSGAMTSDSAAPAAAAVTPRSPVPAITAAPRPATPTPAASTTTTTATPRR